MATAEMPMMTESSVQMPDEPLYDISSLGDNLVLKHRKAVEFDEKTAEHVLELVEFVGDRPTNEPHVIFLARQMEGGTFRWEQVNIISCFFQGREYRMNGRHTAWARLHATLPKGTRTPVMWLKYEAKTEQDMRQLYATIDRGKARSMGNVVISYLVDRPELPGCSKSTLRILAQGLALWLWDERDRRTLHTGDDRAYLLLTDHNKTAQLVSGFIKHGDACDKRHLLRAATVAAMFATFGKAPNIAKEFWPCVRDGLSVGDKADARYTLRNWLLTSSVAKSSLQHEVRSVTAEEMYRGCIYAWNAYRSNKPLKSIRVNVNDDRPEAK